MPQAKSHFLVKSPKFWYMFGQETDALYQHSTSFGIKEYMEYLGKYKDGKKHGKGR